MDVLEQIEPSSSSNIREVSCMKNMTQRGGLKGYPGTMKPGDPSNICNFGG